MIKTYIILPLTIILLLTKNSFSQTINTDKRYPSVKYESIDIDMTLYNIVYKYDYIKDLKSEEKRSSLTILEIGKNYSKFSDIHTLKLDSLFKSFDKSGSIGAREINLVLPLMKKTGFKKEVFKNLQNDSITFHGKIHSTKYEYTEKSPDLNWKLLKNKKLVLNYTVKKAVVNYGNRKWIAWYTEQIPINLGPYIFSNLPGLILELYDDKNNFHFLAVGINNTQKKIYKRTEKRIEKVSKRDFFKAEKNFHEKPELFIKAITKGKVDYKKIPYNPIELTD